MDKENTTVNSLNKFNNINIDENSIIIINNANTIEELIKIIKENKLAKPLAVAKVKQGEFQIILSNIEHKKAYGRSLTVIPWGSQRFEYILSSSKIVITKDTIINYLWKNWGVNAILEPNFIEEIFTGTYKLVTSKKLNANQRNFEIERIFFYINISIKKRKTTNAQIIIENDAKMNPPSHPSTPLPSKKGVKEDLPSQPVIPLSPINTQPPKSASPPMQTIIQPPQPVIPPPQTTTQPVTTSNESTEDISKIKKKHI